MKAEIASHQPAPNPYGMPPYGMPPYGMPYGMSPYGMPPYGQPVQQPQQDSNAIAMMKMEVELEKMRADQRAAQEASRAQQEIAAANQRAAQEATRAQQEIAAVKMQAAQEAATMKMANEFMRLRSENGQQQPVQQQQNPYGQPYGYQPAPNPYGMPPYGQPVQQVQPQQPVQQVQPQQLPPVQPIIIHTAPEQPAKKVIDADAPHYQQAPAQNGQTGQYPPDSVTTSTTTTTTRVDTTKGHESRTDNDFYDIDGFYDNYNNK